jgi:hypothetical protein
MTETPDRTESVFAAAVALADAEERAAYLEQACAGDAALRGRVEALLRAHARAGHLLDRPVPGGPELTAAYGGALPGTIIAGRYKLLEEIGEGGMGTVWVTEQTQPVRRKVALKLIKAGMDSKAVLARFEAERQALAVMDHPNIAKVLDGGVTDTGRPFFVMEYVKGVSITEYCETTRLSVPERLRLFVQVCAAVQHAHQKGIIHRDLKPSNILVAPYDDRPVPKVIDFGLAKALHQPLTERTLHTAHEAVLGTPLYMSPEQAQLNNLDVDTRSDIYSLGVLLYELLTGTTPLEKKRFKDAAWEEVKRLIREEEPPKPSTRLSSTATLPSLAACRQTEPARLKKLVRGELDWIVMKALEKDRSRRFETANGFARDVERYLAGEPVLAAPPGARYRLGKFLRRHRGPVAAAAALLLALLLGIGGTTWGLLRAEQRRAEAEAARADEARERALAQEKEQEAQRAKEKALKAARAEAAALEQTKRRLAQIEKGVDLLASLLSGIDPRKEQKGGLPLYEQLRERASQAADQLDAESVGDALAVARLQTILGRTLAELGDSARAVAVLEKACATRERELGDEDPLTLDSRNSLACAYRAAGKLDLAIPLHERTLKASEAKLGEDHPKTLTSRNNLACAYQAAGKLDLAIPLFVRTLQAFEAKQLEDHHDTLTLRNNLAMAYQAAGKLDLAIPLFVRTLQALEAKLGDDHPDTLQSRHNLAGAYQVAGQLDRAIPLFVRTLQAREAKLGDDHPDTLQSRYCLACAYRDAGQLDRALPLFERAAVGVEKGRFEQKRARRIIANTIAAYEAAKRLDKAGTWRRKWLAQVRQQAGESSPAYASELAALGANLLQRQKWSEAEAILRECLAIRRQAQPDAWNTFNMESLLGSSLLGQKKYAEAEPLLLSGYAGMKEREKTIPPPGKARLPEAAERLAQLYEATGKKDEAAKWRKELEALRAPTAKSPTGP